MEISLYLPTTEADHKKHGHFRVPPKNWAVQKERGNFHVPRDKADQKEHGNFHVPLDKADQKEHGNFHAPRNKADQ